MKKYEFTGRQMEANIPEDVELLGQRNAILHEIRALVDIPEHHVQAKDVGGWLESENNLSHEGTCWVQQGSQVSGNSIVQDNAIVSGDSIIRGNSHIQNNAEVRTGCIINNGRIADEVKITSAFIHKSSISGHVRIAKGVLNNVRVVGEPTQSGEGVILRECIFRNNEMRLGISNRDSQQLVLEHVELEFKHEEDGHSLYGSGYVKNLKGKSINYLSLDTNLMIENVRMLGNISILTLHGTERLRLIGTSNEEPIILDTGFFMFDDANIAGQVHLKGDIYAVGLTATDFAVIQNQGKDWLELENVELKELSKLIRSNTVIPDAIKATQLCLDGDAVVYAK